MNYTWAPTAIFDMWSKSSLLELFIQVEDVTSSGYQNNSYFSLLPLSFAGYTNTWSNDPDKKKNSYPENSGEGLYYLAFCWFPFYSVIFIFLYVIISEAAHQKWHSCGSSWQVQNETILVSPRPVPQSLIIHLIIFLKFINRVYRNNRYLNIELARCTFCFTYSITQQFFFVFLVERKRFEKQENQRLELIVMCFNF